jgi:hypothetical protein
VAIASLRAQGRLGLQRVLARYDAERSAARADAGPAWDSLVDAVAGQRDARYGRLFWHTDLATARRDATARGLPILSLRMLGRLTDELSCANSRFFRTALYSDPELAGWLDDRFVLHWSSERPVPIIDIDLGDGRTIRRTITGNSAHYVLDAEARPIDVVPGLYGATAFRNALMPSLQLHDSLTGLTGATRSRALRRHHRGRVDAAASTLARAMAELGSPAPLSALRGLITAPPLPNVPDSAPPPAVVPNLLTVGKAAVEVPMLRKMGAAGTRPNTRRGRLQWAMALPTDQDWEDLARRSIEQARLDPAAVALVARQYGSSTSAADRVAMITEFEEMLAEDSLRNELRLRPVVHQWFATWAVPAVGPQRTFEQLNARVYSELFLTPADDPWIGLWNPRVYDGLTNAGRSQGIAAASDHAPRHRAQ